MYWSIKFVYLQIGLLHPVKKRRSSDVSQMSGQSMDQNSLLKRSEGVAIAMQCNFHRQIISSYTQVKETN